MIPGLDVPRDLTPNHWEFSSLSSPPPPPPRHSVGRLLRDSTPCCSSLLPDHTRASARSPLYPLLSCLCPGHPASCHFPAPACLFPADSPVPLFTQLCPCSLSSHVRWLSPAGHQEGGQPQPFIWPRGGTDGSSFSNRHCDRWPLPPSRPCYCQRTQTLPSILSSLPAGHFCGTLREQRSGREPEGPGALQPLVPDGHDCGWRGSAGLALQSEMTRH